MAEPATLETVKRITIFGQGITARAVHNTLLDFPEFSAVEADESPDLGIVSPGIEPEPLLAQYTFPIISELEFAVRIFDYLKKIPFLIVVSGTNGKTTTTSMISQLLKIPFAGNIGVPLIQFAKPPIHKIPEMIVVEASSYQMEMSPTLAPDIYILLNITEDHLARHKTMDRYGSLKFKLARQQAPNQWFLYQGQDPLIKKTVATESFPGQSENFLLAEKKYSRLLDQSPIPGDHNRQNLSAAIMAASKTSIQNWEAQVPNLRPVEHRLETIDSPPQLTVINDSKATNPDSTLAALRSFDPKRTILLLGGEKKQASYDPIFQLIKNQAIRVICFGQDGPVFLKSLHHLPGFLGYTESMNEAIKLAFKKATNHDIILFSPGCASFDAFNNFEERGHEFKRIVSQISTQL